MFRFKNIFVHRNHEESRPGYISITCSNLLMEKINKPSTWCLGDSEAPNCKCWRRKALINLLPALFVCFFLSFFSVNLHQRVWVWPSCVCFKIKQLHTRARAHTRTRCKQTANVCVLAARAVHSLSSDWLAEVGACARGLVFTSGCSNTRSRPGRSVFK